MENGREQRYNEEQDRIDRETKKKLQEKADAEKMEHLPSDAKAKKYIRVSKQTFKAVCAGLLPYLLLKYEKYSAGEIAVIQIICLPELRQENRLTTDRAAREQHREYLGILAVQPERATTATSTAVWNTERHLCVMYAVVQLFRQSTEQMQ